MDKSDEHFKVEILHKECETASESIRANLLQGNKIVSIGFTIVSGGLVYGLKEEIYFILLLLPFAFFAVAMLAADMLSRVMATGAYKRYLEEKINKSVNDIVVGWEIFISPTLIHFDFTKKILIGIYSTIWLITIYVSLQTAWEQYTLGTFLFILSLIILMIILMTFSLCKLTGIYNKIYKTMQDVSVQDNREIANNQMD